MKSMVVVLVVVGSVIAGLAFFARETGDGPAPKMNWKDGETVDVELTLVASDKDDLGCAYGELIKGDKHCAFEAEGKPWSKGGGTDDKSLLKPYTTTNKVELIAAGLWSQPFAAQLPKGRFSVKCKYTVDQKVAGVGVRWRKADKFAPRQGESFVGSLSDCQLPK